GDRDAWREAAAAQREAIDRLVGLAERLVREERGSLTPALGDQIRDTLQAAAIDPDAREAVAAGRLSRELRPSGAFGAFGELPAEGGGRRSVGTRTGSAEREAQAARRAAERDARSGLRRAEKDAATARGAAER